MKKGINALQSATFATIFAVLSLAAFNPTFAENPAEQDVQLGLDAETAENSAKEEGGFKPGELIIHHVIDNYEIHIADHLSISLPLILFTDNGLDIFSYSNFLDEHHEPVVDYTSEKTGNTYHYNHGHITIIEANDQATEQHSGWGVNDHSFIDISITKNVVGMLGSVLLLVLVFFSVAGAAKKRGMQAPNGLQGFMEPLILFIRDEVARPSLGDKADKFVPYLLSLFFFIWLGNLLGLIPFLGGMNITGNIAVTLVLALFTFILVNINGNKGYWMHMIAPPGVPLWLLPLMIPIEIAGVFIRHGVLCLRLFANITAGHIIILAFACLIFIFNQNSGAGTAYGVAIASTLFTVFMLCLELLVAFLQAYVFVLLSALYLGQATEDAHH